jgi:hypothetical protein
MVIFFWKKCRPVSFMPLASSSRKKLENRSLIGVAAAM